MVKRPVKVNRNDYARVLITETLPAETPIIFSGDGLYDLVKKQSSSTIHEDILNALVYGTVGPNNIHSTVPFHYKIRKNSKEFRKLTLMHPRAQWRAKEFYEAYESLILHFCSVSPATIRAPKKVTGSFYRKSSWENINQYRSDGVMRLSEDQISKHIPSYFAYRGFDRLFKFFESKEFYDLEKDFEILQTLDVSKCFDSIYTHCLSWAVKDKEFTKLHVAVESTFPQQFDALMRYANHNETNGIVIGPEVSRIFAEILFQKIDTQVIDRLYDLPYGKHFVIRRYVDDVFIFARSQSIAARVHQVYSDILSYYNLHYNTSKSTTLERPFITKKSTMILAATRETENFLNKFLKCSTTTESVVPLEIESIWGLTKSYLSAIKSLCYSNQSRYDDISSYLISVITERIKKLIDPNLPELKEDIQKHYRDALVVLIDAIFFFYDTSPSVTGSYKVCTSILVATRFAKKSLPLHFDSIAQRIYELTENHLAQERQGSAIKVSDFVPLEMINVLLAVRELGDNYLLPENKVSDIFLHGKNYSYFNLVCCIFYIKDTPSYAGIMEEIIHVIDLKFEKFSNILMNSELAYLFIDLIACPYIATKIRRKWIKKLYPVINRSAPTNLQIDQYLQTISPNHSSVRWTDVDLLVQLEKKELKAAYQ